MHRPLIYSFSLSLFPSFWHQAQQQSERGGKSGQTRKRRTRNRWRGRTARASTLYCCCCCCLCVCDPEKRDSRIHNTLLTTWTRIQVTLIRSLSLLERCISRRQLTRARPSLSLSLFFLSLFLRVSAAAAAVAVAFLRPSFFSFSLFLFFFLASLRVSLPATAAPLFIQSRSLASSRDAGVFPSSSSSLLSLSLLPVYGFLGHRVSLSLPQNLSSRQRERERGERKEVEESEWRSGEGGRREGE